MHKQIHPLRRIGEVPRMVICIKNATLYLYRYVHLWSVLPSCCVRCHCVRCSLSLNHAGDCRRHIDAQSEGIGKLMDQRWGCCQCPQWGELSQSVEGWIGNCTRGWLVLSIFLDNYWRSGMSIIWRSCNGSIWHTDSPWAAAWYGNSRAHFPKVLPLAWSCQGGSTSSQCIMCCTYLT